MNNDLGLICSPFEVFHEAISFEQNRLLKSSYTQEIFHKKIKLTSSSHSLR